MPSSFNNTAANGFENMNSKKSAFGNTHKDNDANSDN